VNQLTYRYGRLHIVMACAVVAALATGGLGYLLARDFSLSRQTPMAGATPGLQQTGQESGSLETAGGAAGTAGTSGTAARTVTRTGPGAATGAAIGIQDGTITIGAVITQSGLGDETSIYHGLDAAIKEVNANGGVHGLHINLEVLDDGSDPNRGASNLRRLVENDHVFALVGECAPLTDINLGPYFEQQGVPVFGSCFTSNDQFKNPEFFPLVLKPYTEGGLMAKYLMKQMGSKKPALVSLNVNILDQSYDGALAELRAELGHDPCDAEKADITQTLYDSIVLNEQSNGCDGVILNLDPPHILDWLQAAQRYGYDAGHRMLGLTAFDSLVVQQGGTQAEGMVTYYAQYMPSVDTNQAAIAHYNEVWRRYHPDDPNANLGLVGYLAGSSFAKELAGVSGEITRDAFVKHLFAAPLDSGLRPAAQWTPANRESQNACRFYVLRQKSFQPLSDWFQ
jgi:ABC-type branched-subunit amino acid transport system substrate-binding protein